MCVQTGEGKGLKVKENGGKWRAMCDRCFNSSSRAIVMNGSSMTNKNNSRMKYNNSNASTILLQVNKTNIIQVLTVYNK